MEWGELELQVVSLTNAREVAAVRAFLQPFGLSFEADVEYTVTLHKAGRIVGTGSLAGEVLRNIAVLPEMQGEGLTATIVTRLMAEAGRRGRFHYFIFTRPDKTHLFTALGFNEIARAEPYAALLESGLGSVRQYCEQVKAAAVKLPDYKPGHEVAALVVNCNPFTLGHQALIRRAAAENRAVIVFVVAEDRSLFPFSDRIRLVREGTAALVNVAVVSGDKYIVSAATFPGYFTRGEETVAAQTRLDVELFAGQLVPTLGITSRYVGEEPYCPVTSQYNQAMLDILPQRGVTVRVIQRHSLGGEIISASKVRDAIRRDDWLAVQAMVPETTYHYLTSPAAAPVMERIKREPQARH